MCFFHYQEKYILASLLFFSQKYFQHSNENAILVKLKYFILKGYVIHNISGSSGCIQQLKIACRFLNVVGEIQSNSY